MEIEENAKTETFVFYKSFYDAMDGMDDIEFGKVCKALCKIAYYGESPDYTNMSKLGRAVCIIATPLIDSSIMKYQRAVKAGKKSGESRAKRNELKNEHSSELSSLISSELKNEPNDNDNDNVNVNVNENGNIEPLAPDYSQAIFNLYKDADLPCCKGNYTSFIQRDFKTALEYLKGYHSDEVIQAVKNYIAELKNPDSFISQKMNFDSFVRSKLFSRMLPDNYSAENNKDFEKQKFNSSIPFYDTSTRTLDSIRARQKEEDERWEREHGKQNTEMS